MRRYADLRAGRLRLEAWIMASGTHAVAVHRATATVADVHYDAHEVDVFHIHGRTDYRVLVLLRRPGGDGPDMAYCRGLTRTTLNCSLRLRTDVVLEDQPGDCADHERDANRNHPPLVESKCVTQHARRKRHPERPVAARREET